MKQKPIFNAQPCISCGNEKFTQYLSTRDFFLSSEEFNLIECINCKLIRTEPIPVPSEIQFYYNSEKYISHSGNQEGIVNKLYNQIKKITLRQKLKTIEKYSSQGRSIIDYGSGSGDFLNILIKHKWNALGFDPSVIARDQTFLKYGISTNPPENIHDLKSATFDIITLWHVLEHSYNPPELLNTFFELLKPDGHLFIAVPNIHSFDARFYNRYWAALDVPRHIFHFSHHTINKIAEDQGFKLIRKQGMLFDAFYISFLSENYMKNSLQYFRAPFIGLYSNLYAFFSDNNYSSVLYIFKKT